MRNAPKRPIKSRVRPRLEWLEAVTRLPAQVTLLPRPGDPTVGESTG